MIIVIQGRYGVAFQPLWGLNVAARVSTPSLLLCQNQV